MENKKLWEQINNLLGCCREMAEREEEPMWGEWAEALEEIQDILCDYDRQAEQIEVMIRKYEHADNLVRVNADPEYYLCPSCNHRVHPKHTHCHWCGKKVKTERKENVYRHESA